MSTKNKKRSSDKHSTPSGTIDVGRREKRSAEKKCKKVTEWPVNNSEVQQTRSQFFSADRACGHIKWPKEAGRTRMHARAPSRDHHHVTIVRTGNESQTTVSFFSRDDDDSRSTMTPFPVCTDVLVVCGTDCDAAGQHFLAAAAAAW